jgi:hypothetical protein
VLTFVNLTMMFISLMKNFPIHYSLFVLNACFQIEYYVCNYTFFHFPIEFLRLSNIDEVPGAITYFFTTGIILFSKRDRWEFHFTLKMF